MTITKGVTLGPYEVLSHIGSGGMGDVWRARDRRIGRDVAIKVLPDVYAPGDERVRRFEQEARAAGALSHPGLITIFDVGTVDGAPYIVMELLEGETLRDAIGESPAVALPLRKAIDYAVQTASALAVAHEKGIIHRDLKPENIFVTSDGRVKILDFGLAKLAPEAKEMNQTGRHLTSSGMVVGTPGYMSPEQVGAKPLDHRTDLFSFGTVLYEMICGCRAFDRGTAVETMMAVLNDDPEPLPTKVQSVPPALDEIVRHCLEKNPRERFQSARDLAFQLRVLPEFQNSRTGNARAVAEPKLRMPAAVVAAAAVVALAGAGFAIYRSRGAVSQQQARTFAQLTFRDGLAASPALSPDGKILVYVYSSSGKRDIYEQRVDGRAAINLTADLPGDNSEPALSPDGSQIAFRSERDGGGVFVMGITGESVRRVTTIGHDPAWSPDGMSLAIATATTDSPYDLRLNSEILIADAHSGKQRPLRWQKTAAKNPTDSFQPSWSPHNRRIAFWGTTGSGGQRDIWTIDPNAVDPEKTMTAVTSDAATDWNPVWSPDGKSIYFGSDRDGTLNLWRIAVDEESGKALGAPEPLSLPAPISGHFSFSQSGELAYAAVTRSYRLMAVPVDAQKAETGPPRQLFGGSLAIKYLAPSPDRQRVAFTTGGAQEDLFIVDATGAKLSQLTNDAAKDRGPVWTPDGKTLYFYSNRGGVYHIWRIHADGSELTAVTDERDFRQSGADAFFSPNVSPDGKTLAVQFERDGVLRAALLHLDRPPGQRVEPLANLGFGGVWSPDGLHLAGTTFPGVGLYSLQTRRFEKLLASGMFPQWLPGGRRFLFFDKQAAGIFDLDRRQATTFPSPSPDLRVAPRLSRDGLVLYTAQRVEQGDIWLIRFESRG